MSNNKRNFLNFLFIVYFNQEFAIIQVYSLKCTERYYVILKNKRLQKCCHEEIRIQF